MIRFRPKRLPITLSLKDEEIFDSIDEMLAHIHKHISRLSVFLGGHAPIRPDEIIVDQEERADPIVGWKNVHAVRVSRIVNTEYKHPVCIGFCGE